MHAAGADTGMVWQLQQQLSAAPAHAAAQPLFDTAEGLETPIQLIYLTALLGFLAAGAYLVVRQVLIRRELDEAAKALGERIRTGEATCEVRRRRQAAEIGAGGREGVRAGQPGSGGPGCVARDLAA